RLSRPALRRPAAAGRDRPGIGDGAGPAAVRRADLRARSRTGRRSAESDPRAGWGGTDDAAGHARDGVRARGGDPRAVPASGPGRGGRPAGRFVRLAALGPAAPLPRRRPGSDAVKAWLILLALGTPLAHAAEDGTL